MSTLTLSRAQALGSLLVFALAACGGSSGGTDVVNADEGQLVQGSDSFFFVDANRGGQGAALRLAEAYWARLVDLYDVDAGGARATTPIQRDLPVDPSLTTGGPDYIVDTNALGGTNLVIRYPRGTPDFERALRAATQTLPTVVPKNDSSSTSGPFTLVPRNASLVLRFDDLLEDGSDARLGLVQSVRPFVGYPPRSLFQGRILFDASHGGQAGDGFHSTRIIIDPTVSPTEQANGNPFAVNPIGFPESLTTNSRPNVSVRLATKEDFGSGLFFILRNLRGIAIDPIQSGPNDPNSVTLDVVRAMRSDNRQGLNNGFLFDEVPPSIVGRWGGEVLEASADPLNSGGFLLRFGFETSCQKAVVPGELLETNGGFLEVTEASATPNPSGEITMVRARPLGANAPRATDLLGLAHLFTIYDAASMIDPACFVDVLAATSPEPGAPITSRTTFRLHFNEPMDPVSFDPLESVQFFSGNAPTASSTIVGSLMGTPEATRFLFEPSVLLEHLEGQSEMYTLALSSGSNALSDLAGNAPAFLLPPLGFSLDPAGPTVSTGGISLRFDSDNEYVVNDPPRGYKDLRGAYTRDAARGVLNPRPIVRQGWPIDGTSPVTSIMLPLGVPIQEPLVPLGSRLQTLWRYADIGWRVDDETHFDLDVEGVAWAPIFGLVNSDFIQSFELRLGHAVQLPDEVLGGTPPVLVYPLSGLLDAPFEFDENVLEAGGARPINERADGYRIDPREVFTSPTGTLMMPFPVGRGPAFELFTWRDTSIQRKAGFGSGGVPLGIEKTVDPTVVPASVALAGEVPSFGLPLLMEISSYPSDAVGQNGFHVAVVSPGQLFPNFRVHSSGGIGPVGPVMVEPDLIEVPNGGFNPASVPPGQKTRSHDPALYFGQLDTVTRISRVFTVWFDAGTDFTDFHAPLVSPLPANQPPGTQVRLDFRGALAFAKTDGAEFDGDEIDAYGELKTGRAFYPDGIGSWSSDIDTVDGLRYLQVRMTFVSNVNDDLSPELDSFAVAFERLPGS